jgi:hypothetical protein
VRWVTRKHIRVNRMATAWLIRRFIDPAAELSFVEPEEVADVQARTGAVGFDAPGATYPHRDAFGRCSFEALAAKHCASDSVLAEIARIVHGADFHELELAPECAGLVAISVGFPLVSKDDHDTVERASFLYDALYASLEKRRSSRP